MSKLEFYQRPLVAFDPTNKDHRKWFAEFVKTSSWKHCPVRFVCPTDEGFNIPGMIMRQLIDYYVTKEFHKEQAPKDKGPAARRGAGATRTHTSRT